MLHTKQSPENEGTVYCVNMKKFSVFIFLTAFYLYIKLHIAFLIDFVQ